MRAYDSLCQLVSATGANLVEEHLHPESFGSAYAVFTGQAGGRFRLVWDGKEGYGVLQSHTSGDLWQDQGPLIRERLGSTFSNLDAFLATAEQLAAG